MQNFEKIRKKPFKLRKRCLKKKKDLVLKETTSASQTNRQTDKKANYMLDKKSTGFRLAILAKDIKPSSIIHSHSQVIKSHCYKVGLHGDRNCDWQFL